MDWRVRALTAALMTIVMVALVTLIATWLAVGFDPHFLRQWAKAFAIAWPVAAMTAFWSCRQHEPLPNVSLRRSDDRPPEYFLNDTT